MAAIRHLIQLARPTHWIKNLLVLFPLFFAERFGEAWAWMKVGLALAAFCLISSTGYVVNDIIDRQSDREHPRKKDRPLAAGAVSLAAAWVEAAVLLAGSALLGLASDIRVVPFLASYLLLQLAYTFLLKRKMLVDVMCIALGFVIRAAAGAVAIHVEASAWLVVCTFTLCLFMGFCKRRNELATLGEAPAAGKHRPTLAYYTPELLTHLITLSAGVAIISFLLYASQGDTASRFHTPGPWLIYTAPLVIYGVCRFAMLSMVGKYSDPVDLIVHDWPFQVSLAAWAAATFAIIKWGQHLKDFLTGHF